MQNTTQLKMTPDDYEIAVRNVIVAKEENLTDFCIELKELLKGTDGEYEMDVTARFTVFDGANVLVLIECKHHKNPIKRELVQALHSKLLSIGAHKAMMFTSSRFQRGAVEFAQAHGISLVCFAHNQMNYAVKAICVDAIEVVIDEDGNTAYNVICNGNALLKNDFDLS